MPRKLTLQEKLGQWIAALRKLRRLTQVQLAQRIGCSVDFVGLVERGVNALTVARLEDFARVLRGEVRDLFGFKAGKPPLQR